MQQLWLMRKRIDSIDELRELLKAVTEEEKDQLCIRILERLKDGVIQRWLMRQPTNGYLGDVELKKSINLLKSAEINDASQEQCRALSVICGLSEDSLWSPELQRTIKKKEDNTHNRMALLQQQAWWPKYAEMFQSVTDWSLVVTDDAQLQVALEKLPKSSQNGKSRSVLYLCNTNSGSFRINLSKVYDTTIIGVANPRVMHKRLANADVINAKAQGLSLRDFTMRCPNHKYIINHDDSGNGFVQKIC